MENPLYPYLKNKIDTVVCPGSRGELNAVQCTAIVHFQPETNLRNKKQILIFFFQKKKIIFNVLKYTIMNKNLRFKELTYVSKIN